MAEEKHEKYEQAEGFLTKLFTGWGAPEALARTVAGAIVGAVAAYFLATATGCTADYSQNADGSLQYHGTVVLPSGK